MDIGIHRFRSSCIVLGVSLAMTACTAPTARLQLIDHGSDGQARVLHELFPEAFYRIDASGSAEIALRRSPRGDARSSRPITQLVYIKLLWHSIPGETISHRTQINGTVTYAILDGLGGETFEGAGSVFFEIDRNGVMHGTVDRAWIAPARRFGEASGLFGRTELSATFTAVCDDQRVAGIKNEIARLFGSHGTTKNRISRAINPL